MSVQEVAIEMAALIELLQQHRDTVPLGPLVSLLEQGLRNLQHNTSCAWYTVHRHKTFY